jgi:hypothetical protein
MKNSGKAGLMVCLFLIIGVTSGLMAQEYLENPNQHKKHHHENENKFQIQFAVSPYATYWGFSANGGKNKDNAASLGRKIGFGIEGSAGLRIPTSIGKSVSPSIFYGIGKAPKEAKSQLKDSFYQNIEGGIVVSDAFRISTGFAFQNNRSINSSTLMFVNTKNAIGFNLGIQFLHKKLNTLETIVPRLGISANF